MMSLTDIYDSSGSSAILNEQNMTFIHTRYNRDDEKKQTDDVKGGFEDPYPKNLPEAE